MEMYWLAGGGVLVAALLASFRMQMLQQRRLARLDERLAHLTAGVSLLTDTAESGMRDIANELQRIGADGRTKAAKPKTRTISQRRVAGAARRGVSVREIAASEEMSESEVRLRLQIAGTAKEKAHATVR